MSNVALQLDPVYLEQLYEQYKADPDSLDPSWQLFFQGFDLASCPRTCVAAGAANDQSSIASLIYNYRDQGFRLAQTDPLGHPPPALPDLELARYGFSEEDLERVFDTGHLGGAVGGEQAPQRATLREIIEILSQTYCGSIGVQYLHISDVAIRRWLQQQMEPVRNRPDFDLQRKLQILEQLADAELLETFIQRHYLGQKRFSLEGGETLIPLVHAVMDQAPTLGVEEIVLGMAHRGRLNVLANLLDKSYATIFSEFEDNFLGEAVSGDGDVKYHKGFSSDHQSHLHEGSVHLSLTSNPSHLEAVDPVVLGRARAKQRQRDDAERRQKVLPLLIHGDAAFAGQGLVAETFNMSRLPGYQAGGTLHVVVNNQIGFTTLPGQARSTEYATDIAKMAEAPIFHVNGDDPEAAVYVAELALRFRQEFSRDVVIDMVCYRRHGHSEGDEPGFTQPQLYREIRQHPPVRKLYAQSLVQCCELATEQEQAIDHRMQQKLGEALSQAREGTPEPADVDASVWTGLDGPYSDASVETAVPHEALVEVARALTAVPEGFNLNPKVARLLPKRLEQVEQRGLVEWSLAESLAFGSLLLEGTPVRLSGQDSERGTFSQRHAVWRDTETEAAYKPLNQIRPAGEQAHFCVYNSPLSEASVLGFDYGYSLAEPRMLVLWEAQFGDFANGAQVIIDQFIAAAGSKWQRYSGLVMLLPHGYEGQGPEHSNAYVERYLAACASKNIQVCNPSTPAQYFHVLRRQMRRDFRRPLILFTPKSLLRLPAATSAVETLERGSFEEVLEEAVTPASPRRIVLCCGKVYYDLAQARDEAKIDDVALVRVEQLYPFPARRLGELLSRHPEAELVWCQEEPHNRGARAYIEPRLRALAADRPLRYAGRRASASPAVGSLKRHRKQQAALVDQALSPATNGE